MFIRHQWQARTDQPLVALDCQAVPWIAFRPAAALKDFPEVAPYLVEFTRVLARTHRAIPHRPCHHPTRERLSSELNLNRYPSSAVALRVAGRIMAGMLVAVLAACSSTVVDVAGPGGLGTDYVPGAVYVLLNDRYLDTPQGWPTPPLVVVASPHSYSYEAAPRSMDEYRSSPGRWPKIRGVLPAGTRIRLDRIERHSYPGLEDWCEVTGIVESGEFRGSAVNLAFISSAVPGTRMFRVNPTELRPETDGQ